MFMQDVEGGSVWCPTGDTFSYDRWGEENTGFLPLREAFFLQLPTRLLWP
jgi:hypothetical protein